MNGTGSVEYLHRLIKCLYRQTSKVQTSAVQETVHRFNTHRITISSNRLQKRHKIMNDRGNMKWTRKKKNLKTGDRERLVRKFV